MARLAPPGILKYEDIASEKPPNPAIEEEVAARTENADARFPVLSRTPAAGRAPRGAPKAERDAEASVLVDARDTVNQDLERHRDAEAADREIRDQLIEEQSSLSEQIDQDEIIARRERAQPMPSLKQPVDQDN